MENYTKVIEQKIEFVISIFEKIGAQQIELKNGICWTLNGSYFRPDTISFAEKPFIVIEITNNMRDAENNVYEDADPFPYDLNNIEIEKEVLFSIFH
ncbi:MAG: hypothetical protein K0R92_2764 [Lachnospiraceae bacterium]|nr:hypothetical protein [Lachnospiraceae bacterium]